MRLSERIKALQASPIRRLLPYSDEAKAKGKKVYHLNIGQPDIKTPDEYFEAIHNFKVATVAYAQSQGLNELRDAMSAYYHSWDIPLDRNDIFITNGGSEALSFAVPFRRRRHPNTISSSAWMPTTWLISGISFSRMTAPSCASF